MHTKIAELQQPINVKSSDSLPHQRSAGKQDSWQGDRDWEIPDSLPDVDAGTTLDWGHYAQSRLADFRQR